MGDWDIFAGRSVRFLAGPSLCLYTNASSLSVLYTGGSMSIGADLSLGSMLSGRVLETEKKRMQEQQTNIHFLSRSL